MYLNSTEFKELKSITAYVCNITQEMAEASFQAFINKDVEKAQYIRERDRELDDYSIKSDELCGKIIALYWPRGSDMRYLISTIKTVSDFERIGDHCKKISKQIIKLQNTPHVFERKSLIELFENVKDTVVKSCIAFYNLDKEKAEEIINNDDKIDMLKSAAVKDILQFMGSINSTENNISYLKSGINLINIARRLERMADHASNISEAVYYTVTGMYKSRESVDEKCINN